MYSVYCNYMFLSPQQMYTGLTNTSFGSDSDFLFCLVCLCVSSLGPSHQIKVRQHKTSFESCCNFLILYAEGRTIQLFICVCLQPIAGFYSKLQVSVLGLGSIYKSLQSIWLCTKTSQSTHIYPRLAMHQTMCSNDVANHVSLD